MRASRARHSRPEPCARRPTDPHFSWQHAQTIADIAFATVGGDLRTSPLPSAEIDGAGKVYVAWEDCRFRPKCSSNDIVFSSSSDGVNWSAVTRVPIDPVTSGCALSAGFISSTDGGAHWSAPTQLVGPMSLGEIANTSQGPMVGDYISTSFNQSGAASALSAVGLVPKPPAAFDEAMSRPPPR